MVNKRIRRTLVSFTDTQTEARRKIALLRKRGATHIKVKKELGAYAIYAKPSMVMKKELRAF